MLLLKAGETLEAEPQLRPLSLLSQFRVETKSEVGGEFMTEHSRGTMAPGDAPVSQMSDFSLL